MNRLRNVLPLLVVSLLFVGCGADEAGEEEAAPEGDAARAAAGTPPPFCNQPPYPDMTGPIVDITVDGDSLLYDPDPVVRPLRGPLGWRMTPAQADDYGWKVVFQSGDTPLPKDVYFDSAGGKVQDNVLADAECRRYKYSITVWPQADPTDTIYKDPDVDIIP